MPSDQQLASSGPRQRQEPWERADSHLQAQIDELKAEMVKIEKLLSEMLATMKREEERATRDSRNVSGMVQR
jgi:hypothetical protein